MKPLFHILCCGSFTLLNLYPEKLKGQHNNRSGEVWKFYTGCWRTSDTSDGQLITRADKSFEWIKPSSEKTGCLQNLTGTWSFGHAAGIPFRAEVVILKFAKGGRKKYQIFPLDTPATIYLYNEHQFHKIPCE